MHGDGMDREENRMKLTKDETETVIMALKEFQGVFCFAEDQDVFDDIGKLLKRFERSLKRKAQEGDVAW